MSGRVSSWGSSKKRAIIIGLVLATLLAGYVVYEAFIINRQTETIISQNDKSLVPGISTNQEDAPDETPAEDLLANYTVAADHPRALYIDKLNVRTRVLPMGIAGDGSIESPKAVFDAGWYTGSAKPGESGAMFLDGHASGATRQGLMAYIDTLVVGDVVRIEKGDGTELLYEVVHVETVPLEGIDMNKVLSVYGDAESGLNIMTCTGTWIPEKLTYDHRVVVYTQQIE
jgi:sortase (surface protein transpeptidase)